jgi:hypothetical protein
MAEQPSQPPGGFIGEGEWPGPWSQSDISATASASHIPNARRRSLTETPTTFAPVSLTGARHAKIAIPRQRSAASPRHGRRVPRACESCRLRKTKCSGDTPVCRQCRELRVTCVYPPGLRERMTKYVRTNCILPRSMIQTVARYLYLLRDHRRLNFYRYQAE